MKAPLPPDEAQRLAALRAYAMLDTPAEESFDDLTELAATICGAPIALITLLDEDRQWFKSAQGLSLQETSRDLAFCAHAIHQTDLFIVPDATQDVRFADNALVTGESHVRFYAGAPLITPDGHALGTLCVLDRQPRHLTADHQQALRILSRHVIGQLEQRRSARDAARLRAERDALKTTLQSAQSNIEQSARNEKDVRRLLEGAEQSRRTLLSLLADRQHAEAALQKSEASLAAAQALVHLGSWELDLSTMTGTYSAEMFRLLYRDPALGVPPFAEFLELVHPDDRPTIEEALARTPVATLPYTIEYRTHPSLGAVRRISATIRVMRDASGQPVRTTGTALDITERTQAEAAVRESETRYRTLFEDAPDGIVIADAEGRYLDANAAMCRMVGYTRDELLGRHASDIVAPAEIPQIDLALDAIKAGTDYHREWQLRRKDGSLFAAEVIATAMPDGNPMGMIRDITERKKAEEKIRAASQQLRALAVRLQSVREQERTGIAREIHDVLAQELTRLKIDLVWLAKRLARPLDEGVRATVVVRVADAIAQTDTAISTVQRIATDLRPVILDSLGLPSAIEWQAEDFARRTGITCRARVPAGETALVRDRATAIFRILQESLTNVVRHAQASAVEVELIEGASAATLTVRDNGVGISPAQMTDPRSIGLLGMNERALAFGGTVEIFGSPGAGTSVTVRIPMEAQPEL